ncbi:MAG TPA: hypothetical protein V6D25_08950 [Leptolyngbyaceae cyanobacterium]
MTSVLDTQDAHVVICELRHIMCECTVFYAIATTGFGFVTKRYAIATTGFSFVTKGFAIATTQLSFVTKQLKTLPH